MLGKSAKLVSLWIALTLLFYLLVYFLLPPPPPSPAMMLLFAGIAAALIWIVQACIRALHRKKSAKVVLLLGAAFLLPGLMAGKAASSPPSDRAQTATANATPPPALHIVILEGEDVSNNIKERTDREPIIQVEDENHRPVVGAKVLFTIDSQSGAGASFNGAKTFSGQTDANGRIVAQGFRPNGRPGTFHINVTAVKGPLNAQTTITQTNTTATTTAAAPPPPPPPRAQSPANQVGGHSSGIDTLPRVTGIALLLLGQSEEAGYGLYSYALLSHVPSEDELPRDRALLKALLEQPEAAQVGKYIPKSRINITYLLLTSIPSNWESLTLDQRVDYALSHYDYGRSAALLASLPQRTGSGPVITSTLAPLSVTARPHPVLVQDLSTAQPVLMEAYVRQFVAQVAQDRFWKAQTLASFSLNLRNVLEVAATGLGMSQDAVKSWIQYLK